MLERKNLAVEWFAHSEEKEKKMLRPLSEKLMLFGIISAILL